MQRSTRPTIVFFIPDLGGGGAERVVLNLVNYYVDHGVPVTLVLARAQGELLSELDERVALVDLGVRIKMLAVIALARYLRRVQPACLVSNMDIANVAACAAQRLSGYAAGRLILCCHLMFSKQIEVEHRLKDRAVAALMCRLYSTADKYIAVSHGVAQDIASLAKLPPSCFNVIHNPAYDETIQSQACADPEHAWLPCSDRNFSVIVTAGRLTHQKDFRTLISALSILRQRRPVYLIILGSGPLKTELTRYAAKLGIDDAIDFAGFRPNPFAYIRRADVFALTSRWEGFGNVLVEALACGTAVVSTDCPAGPAEILEQGKYGTLAPVGDASAIANALLKSIVQKHDREALRERARLFSIENAAASYLSVIRAH